MAYRRFFLFAKGEDDARFFEKVFFPFPCPPTA